MPHATSAGEQPKATGLDEASIHALARIKARNPEADPVGRLPDVPPSRLPRHIAIIMDGNGRWAKARGLPRQLGHQAGAKSVRRIVEACGNLGIEVLTLYSFSMENWKRPQDEVQALMQLCLAYLASEEKELVSQRIRFRVIGRREGLPRAIVEAIGRVEAATKECAKATLCLAINYGSRAEMVDAARALAREVAQGTRTPESIDDAAFAGSLYAPDLPDPDLLIRTAGESRVSNFLLWQISYAEIFVTPTLWPEFGVESLYEAIRDYAKRNRRFGGLDTPQTPGAPHA